MEGAWHPAFRFLLAALAVWRLSFLVARERGPWGVFERLRSRLEGRLLGRLVTCVKCLSVWFAIPFAAFVTRSPLRGVVVWLALSGVASLVDEWTKPAFEWKDASGDELLRGDADGAAQ